GAYTRLELARAEWFRDVIVRAGIEETDLLRVRVTGRQHEDWSARPLAERAADISSGHVRKPEVEDDELRAFGRGEVEASGTILCFHDTRRRRLQSRADDSPDLRLVVDHEDRER